MTYYNSPMRKLKVKVSENNDKISTIKAEIMEIDLEISMLKGANEAYKDSIEIINLYAKARGES